MSLSVGLLQGFELELAYSLVSKVSLDWQPQVDDLITHFCGERLREIDHGDARWSNKGPRHSLRLGSRIAMESLAQARELLSAELKTVQGLAGELDARLLATGMHPWMQPSRSQAWPHGKSTADEALSALYGEARHGLHNQQPLRLSIAFGSDFEFARLFGALRFVMPLMPVLSASSPFAEGKVGPALSCRVAAQRDLRAGVSNSAAFLVPKPSSSCGQYKKEVVAPHRKALEAHSLSANLDAMTLCADGVVADFDAGLVRIEMLDMQECLQADIAVCAGISAITVAVQNEEHASLAELSQWPRARLGELLDRTLVEGGQTVIRDLEFRQAFGFPERGACRAADLWQHLLEETLAKSALAEESLPALGKLVEEGCLASRLLRALPPRWNDEDLFNLYREILDCQEEDKLL